MLRKKRDRPKSKKHVQFTHQSTTIRTNFGPQNKSSCCCFPQTRRHRDLRALSASRNPMQLRLFLCESPTPLGTHPDWNSMNFLETFSVAVDFVANAHRPPRSTGPCEGPQSSKGHGVIKKKSAMTHCASDANSQENLAKQRRHILSTFLASPARRSLQASTVLGSRLARQLCQPKGVSVVDALACSAANSVLGLFLEFFAEPVSVV